MKTELPKEDFEKLLKKIEEADYGKETVDLLIAAWISEQRKTRELQAICKTQDLIILKAVRWIKDGIDEGQEKDILENLKGLVKKQTNVPPDFEETFQKYFNELLA